MFLARASSSPNEIELSKYARLCRVLITTNNNNNHVMGMNSSEKQTFDEENDDMRERLGESHRSTKVNIRDNFNDLNSNIRVNNEKHFCFLNRRNNNLELIT